MKIAIVGSRNLNLDLCAHVPVGVTEIVSGGAKGIDSIAKVYAQSRGIKFTEFLPEYSKYGRCAPLKRNEQIVEHCDIVLAVWDGVSKGTKYTIDYARRCGKPVILVDVRC